MKVLMLGWEFPPFKSGGLGTACFGLTKGLSQEGVHVTFVMPKAKGDISSTHVNLIVANRFGLAAEEVEGSIEIKEINSLLKGYITSDEYAQEWYRKQKKMSLCMDKSYAGDDEVYGKDLYEEVYRFAEKSRLIAQFEDFDVIHGHDWMTYQAAVKIKEATGKPLVLHIHATEFDRTAGHPNQIIYDIERIGFEKADVILAVSEWTRQKVINNYNISPDKVKVVHNAIEFTDYKINKQEFALNKHDKVVLFLGRLTVQKGPEHFLWAAKKVLDVEKNVRFVVAGSGDMEYRMIEEANNLGIADNMVFTGFLTGKDVDRAFSMADLYVMPSISEPFGLTPLESMRNGTPCLISKQSGVSEVLKNCLKVDFWDIDQMASKIVSVLRYTDLHEELCECGNKEVYTFSWNVPARKCVDVYRSFIECNEWR